MSDPRRDDVVARALGELPVPDHRPSFWADLEQAIAGDAPGRQSDTGGRTVDRLDTGELPSVRALAHERPGPSRRAPLLALAAGLLVLAGAITAVTLAGDGDGSGGGVAGEPTETTLAGETTVSASPGVLDAPDPWSAVNLDPALVAEWIGALADGDFEAAAARLGPRTASFIQSSTGNDAATYLRGVAGELTGWTGAQDVTWMAHEIGSVPLLGADAALGFVAVAATDPADGRSRMDVFPMVFENGEWHLEQLAYAVRDENEPVFTVPTVASGSDVAQMGPTDDINVFVPATGVVYFQLDGGEVGSDETSMVGRDPKPFALFNPPGDLAPGAHQLVVVAVGDDGTIAHYAGTFVVEG